MGETITMKERSVRILLWGATVLCMAVIFMFSAQNAEASSDTSDGFISGALRFVIPGYGELSDGEISETASSLSHAVRKAAHFSVYCILGILSSCAVGRYSTGRAVRASITLGICIAYAISDEVHQYFVPGRACQLTDVLIDTAGATLGITLTLAASALLRRRRHSAATKQYSL